MYQCSPMYILRLGAASSTAASRDSCGVESCGSVAATDGSFATCFSSRARLGRWPCGRSARAGTARGMRGRTHSTAPGAPNPQRGSPTFALRASVRHTNAPCCRLDNLRRGGPVRMHIDLRSSPRERSPRSRVRSGFSPRIHSERWSLGRSPGSAGASRLRRAHHLLHRPAFSDARENPATAPPWPDQKHALRTQGRPIRT